MSKKSLTSRFMRWWKPGASFSTRRVRAAASPAWTSLGGHSPCLVYATPKEDGSAAEGFQDHQAGWKGPAPRPLFIIGLPFNRKAATPGNGQMTALLAPTRASVNACHAAALIHGGICEGAPVCARTITQTTTALTSAIQRATNSASLVTTPHRYFLASVCELRKSSALP